MARKGCPVTTRTTEQAARLVPVVEGDVYMSQLCVCRWFSVVPASYSTGEESAVYFSILLVLCVWEVSGLNTGDRNAVDVLAHIPCHRWALG